MVIDKTDVFLAKWLANATKRGQTINQKHERLEFLHRDSRPKLREMMRNGIR